MDISSRELTTVSPDEPIGTAVRLMGSKSLAGSQGMKSVTNDMRIK
jgi:hypothetical protein